MAPVLGAAALFIVPGPISQVLPNRFLSRMGHIIPLPPPPAFVEGEHGVEQLCPNSYRRSGDKDGLF